MERYSALGMDDEDSYAAGAGGDDGEGFGELSEADMEALAALEEAGALDGGLAGWGDMLPEGMVFEASVEDLLQGKAARKVLSGGRGAAGRGRAAAAARSRRAGEGGEGQEEQGSQEEDEGQEPCSSGGSRRAGAADGVGGGVVDMDSPGFTWDGIKVTLSEGDEPRFLAGIKGLDGVDEDDAGGEPEAEARRRPSGGGRGRPGRRGGSSSSSRGGSRLRIGGQ
jgi:hypothetical protein